ncbi:hypothetical protein J1783_01440 [Rahnella sp. L151-1A]|nr:hypothetical protein [Rahnella perminowiae]
MPKNSDIREAFVKSLTRDHKRGQVVTTARFVSELAKLNHFWSKQEVNAWIERYQTYFRDYTDHHGEDKCYFLKNMGYVI